MKRTARIITILSITGTLLSVACTETRKKAANNILKEEISKTEMESTDFSESELLLLIEGYLAIKNALVETNAKAASFAAENLRYELKESKNTVLAKFLKELHQIEEVEEVENQRTVFENLSKHIYLLIKTKQLNNMELYYQYCPMAFDDKGAYWISEEEAVFNPYFGDKMLRCGKVVETLIP